LIKLALLSIIFKSCEIMKNIIFLKWSDTILLEHIAHKDETRVYIGNCGNTCFVQALK
jgi:hypothetical protein